MSCKNYYAIIFLYLTTALGVCALSADKSNLGVTLYGKSSTILTQTLGNIFIMMALTYGIYNTQPDSFLKHFCFFGLAFWIGQSMKGQIMTLQSHDLLKKTFLYTGGIFLGMALLGFYDSGNMMGLGPYLMAGLAGLLMVRSLVYALGTAKEKKMTLPFLNYVGIALFGVMVARDVQNLRIQAQSCDEYTVIDYPVDTMQIFMDFVNLFRENASMVISNSNQMRR
jgi:FtsH-binding integral membrane protein